MPARVVSVNGRSSTPHSSYIRNQYSSFLSSGPVEPRFFWPTGRAATPAATSSLTGSLQKKVSVSQTATTSSARFRSAHAAVKTLFAIGYFGNWSFSSSARCSTRSRSNSANVASAIPDSPRGSTETMRESAWVPPHSRTDSAKRTACSSSEPASTQMTNASAMSSAEADAHLAGERTADALDGLALLACQGFEHLLAALGALHLERLGA